MDRLNHVLSHLMASNQLVLENSRTIQDLCLQHRLVENCEQDEGTGGPVMHRWHLRLSALVAPTNAAPLRALGFRFLQATYAASSNCLLANAKTTLSLAMNVLSSPNKAAADGPELFCSAMDLTLLILARSTYHPEWARENTGASVVQKATQSIVTIAQGELADFKLPTVHAIVTLIPLYPTALRPLSPSFHSLAISLLCAESRPLTDAGASLFVSLYLLAPKGRDGLRDAWKKGAEALVGCLDGLTTEVTLGLFAEDLSANHTLGPLALPPLPSPAPSSLVLARLDSLSHALCTLLRTPTTERAGPVPVPIGAVVELGIRLVSLNEETPIKERVDSATVRSVHAALGRLQIIGGRILATCATCTGQAMLAHATDVLSSIANTLSTYPLRSPMRPALSATYSLVLVSLGSGLDPEEGQKSLARVWRCVLEDISAVASSSRATPAGKTLGEGSTTSRKNKKQKTYDPGESMTAQRVSVDELDLEIAKRGLATLERLLSAPHSHSLPPKLQLSTSRLLLFLALDPAFFSTQPLNSSTASSSFFPATSAARALDIAKQDVEFRRGVLRALKMLCASQGSDAAGVAERAIEVWTRGARDADLEIQHVSHSALTAFSSSLLHPLLPPLQINATFARQRADRLGAAQIADNQALEEGAREFVLESGGSGKRKRGQAGVGHLDSAQDEDDGDDDDDDDVVEREVGAQREARRRKMEEDERRRVRDVEDRARRDKEQADVSAKGFEAAGAAGGGGFASFAVKSRAHAQVAGGELADDMDARGGRQEDKEEEEEVLSAMAGFVDVEMAQPQVARALGGGDVDDDDSSDEDDDAVMPTIDVGSDDE